MHLVLTFREWVDRRWEDVPAPEASPGGEENVA
jgi:hypothetical protein